MDMSDRIWKITIRRHKGNRKSTVYGVVIADSEDEARNIVESQLKTGYKLMSLTKADTYPVVLIGGVNTFSSWI